MRWLSWVLLVAVLPSRGAGPGDFVEEAIHEIHTDLKPHTAYLYGGCEPGSQMDCSCYVQYIVEQIWGIDISRTTHTQEAQLRVWLKQGLVESIFDGGAAGRDVALDSLALEPGDLVYSTNDDGGRHVMIYGGDRGWSHSSVGKLGIDYSGHQYLQWAEHRVIGVFRLAQAPSGFVQGTPLTFDLGWEPSPSDLNKERLKGHAHRQLQELLEALVSDLVASDYEGVISHFHPDGLFIPHPEGRVLDEMTRGGLKQWLQGRFTDGWRREPKRVHLERIRLRNGRLVEFRATIEIEQSNPLGIGESVVTALRWRGLAELREGQPGQILNVTPLELVLVPTP